jgi:hypothetical protein
MSTVRTTGTATRTGRPYSPFWRLISVIVLVPLLSVLIRNKREGRENVPREGRRDLGAESPLLRRLGARRPVLPRLWPRSDVHDQGVGVRGEGHRAVRASSETRRIRRLERDIGGKLYHRSTPR